MTASVRADQVILRLHDGIDPAVIELEYQLKLVDEAYNCPVYLFESRARGDQHEIEDQLDDDMRVVWVEENDSGNDPESQNGKGSTIGALFDPTSNYSFNANLLAQIHYSPDYDLIMNRLVKVAILDTGLSPKQPSLWERVGVAVSMVNDNFGPYDWPYGVESNGNGTMDDAVGHGTMVTGLVEMLAPKAEIMVIRISDSDGVAEAWSVIKGLSYAAMNGAEIANISFGSVHRLDAVRKTMDYLAFTQMHIVAPAGNNNSSHAMFPAMESRVICVTGLDESSIKAEFSNYDFTADVSAPATGILSAWWDGTVGIWSGTSFSAPLVTGSLATALSRRSPLSDVSTRASIRYSGDTVDSLNPAYAGKLGRRLNFDRLLNDILFR